MIIKLDHIALRLKDKEVGHNIFKVLGYELADKFDIDFEEEGKVEAYVLAQEGLTEIFMSDGPPETVVGKWVEKNGPGVHHIAYQTDDIEQDIRWFRQNGIEFSTETYLECDDLKQIFTKPIEDLGGLVIELIDRKTKGFCNSNVKDLMNSTRFDLGGEA